MGLVFWRTVAGIRAVARMVVIVAFLYMTFAVLAQVFGRYVFNYSISWSEETARFAQIWVVLIGAGITMQRGLHVAVDSLATLLPLGAARALKIVVAAGCLWFLGVVLYASLPLLQLGWSFETSPVLLIPMWTIYACLPLGAAYFALETVLSVIDRGSTLRHAPVGRDGVAGMTFAFTAFLLLLAVGMPVVFVLGIAAALTLILLEPNIPITIVAQRIYDGLDSFVIMAIPFFVFAGAIMEVGGISRRIVDFATAMVGWIVGSLLMVSVVAATGIAAISGSGSADVAAVSAIMQPELKRRKYDIDFSAAMIASAGSLAQIIPPSLMMVMVAFLSNLSVGALFLSGVIPGLIMSAGLLICSYVHALRGGPQYREVQPFTLNRLGRTFVVALPSLGLPVIIIGGIVGGVFTATEAAAVAVFYGLFISIFIHHDMKISQIPELVLRAASLSAAVMMIIGTASIFGWLVANATCRRNLPPGSRPWRTSRGSICCW